MQALKKRFFLVIIVFTVWLYKLKFGFFTLWAWQSRTHTQFKMPCCVAISELSSSITATDDGGGGERGAAR